MDALEAQDKTAEQKRIAGRHRFQEILLDLAEAFAAAPLEAGGGVPHQPHIEKRRLNDGADIETIALRDLRMRDAPETIFAETNLCVALVGAQRIATRRDEIDDAVEGGAVEMPVGRGGAHLVEEIVRGEGAAHGAAERVLRQHVEPAGTDRRRVLEAEIVGIERGAALENFETVGGDEDRLRGLVEAVIGAADALCEAARPFRRTDIDDEIDVTPVDAEVQRRGTDDSAERPGRHRGLDLAALAGVERAVVQRDGEAIGIDPPQRLKNALGLASCVHEQQRELVRLDRGVELRECVDGRVAGPRHALGGFQDRDVGLGAALDGDEAGEVCGQRRLDTLS